MTEGRPVPFYEVIPEGIDDTSPDLDEKFELNYYINDELLISVDDPIMYSLDQLTAKVDMARRQYDSERLQVLYDEREMEDLR